MKIDEVVAVIVLIDLNNVVNDGRKDEIAETPRQAVEVDCARPHKLRLCGCVAYTAKVETYYR